MLVAADFGREITTTVLWLNGFEGMDIRCVRLVPYDLDGRLFVDVQQVLPLPEAAAYIVHRRRKDVAQERARTGGRDLTQFHVIVDGVTLDKQKKRQAMRTMIEQLASRGVALSVIREQFTTPSFRVLEGSLRDGDSVREALVTQYPSIDTGRWFCDHALVDEAAGKTYVLTKMWGASTEPTMAMLVAEFPEAKVTFRRADPRRSHPRTEFTSSGQVLGPGRELAAVQANAARTVAEAQGQLADEQRRRVTAEEGGTSRH